MSIGRKEAIAVSVGVLLVAAAFVVPHLHLGIVTPLINSTPEQINSFADTAPIFGWWNAHVGWGHDSGDPDRRGDRDVGNVDREAGVLANANPDGVGQRRCRGRSRWR